MRRAGSKDPEGTNHDQNQSPGAVLRRRGFHDAFARAVSKYGAENVYALSISYGQKHVREIEAARAWRPITV